MTYYLAKTEPHEYSIDNLEHDGQIPWTGVENPQAKAFLRSMKVGDHVFIYHSGEKTIVGIAEVSVEGQVPTFKFLKKLNPPFITLANIKAEKMFADLKLVRQSRLSVMEVPSSFVKWVLSE